MYILGAAKWNELGKKIIPIKQKAKYKNTSG
jgi:hypothetical protein